VESFTPVSNWNKNLGKAPYMDTSLSMQNIETLHLFCRRPIRIDGKEGERERGREGERDRQREGETDRGREREGEGEGERGRERDVIAENSHS